MKYLICLILLLTSDIFSFGQKPRARDIGIPFQGIPGKYNAITDVKGVVTHKEGHDTITCQYAAISFLTKAPRHGA